MCPRTLQASPCTNCSEPSSTRSIEKGPVDASVKKAKYTLNDTGLLGDDVEYSVLVRLTHSQIHTGCQKYTHRFEMTCFPPHTEHKTHGAVAMVTTKPPPGDCPLLCDIHFQCQCSWLRNDTSSAFQSCDEMDGLGESVTSRYKYREQATSSTPVPTPARYPFGLLALRKAPRSLSCFNNGS